MVFIQRDYWECPFCGQPTIEVLLRPAVFSAKRSASRSGRKITMRKTREEMVILSEKCSNCGKTREEIEKVWKKEGIL